MFRLLSAPIYVQWEVVSNCNYNCVHCYNYWRSDKKVSKDFGSYGLIVDELIKNKVFSVTITGGEPLLVFDSILPYLYNLREAGIRISLNSNMALFNEAIALELKNLGISSILVSIPSANSKINELITQRKDSLNLTTRGIEIALKYNMNVVANMVVTKLNLKDILLTAEYIHKIGVKNFSATKASTPTNCKDFSEHGLSLLETRSLLSDLLEVQKCFSLNVDSLEFYPACMFSDEKTREIFGLKRSCSAGKTNCTIGFDGQVRPCSHAPHIYGDIRSGLNTAWLKMDLWRSDNLIPIQCKKCNLKYRCGGGCKIEALSSTGFLNEPDPFCDFSQLPILLPKEHKKNEKKHSNNFSFSPFLKLRKESFGGILYVGPNQWVTVDDKLFNFVCKMKGGDINVDQMMSFLNFSLSEVGELVSYLCSYMILKEV